MSTENSQAGPVEPTTSTDDPALALQRGQLTLQREQLQRELSRFRRERWILFASVAAVVSLVFSALAAYQGQLNITNQRDSLTAQYDSLQAQYETARLQDEAARYSSPSELALELNRILLEHPTLLPCFRNGRCPTDLTRREWAEAVALAVHIVDYFQYLYAQLQNLGMVPRSGEFVLRADWDRQGLTNDDWITWSETIVGGFSTSALLCDTPAGSKAAYSADFVRAVRTAKACPALS